MSEVIGKERCPKCARGGRDRSGDNLVCYDDGGKHCYACSFTIPSKQWLIENGEDYEEEYEIEEMSLDGYTAKQRKNFTLDMWQEYSEELSYDPQGYRGLNKAVCRAYRVMHEFDPESGEMLYQFYPQTSEYKYSGVKIRMEPKDFRALNTVGKECELFGQWKFKNAKGKFVVLTAGELDALSAYQMLEKGRNKDYEAIPVVSGTTGESSSYRQVQAQYDWLNGFDKILICYDPDEAGRAAVEKTAKVLPKGKVYVMDLPMDSNDMLMEGKSKEFIRAFWNARKYTPSGISGQWLSNEYNAGLYTDT